MNEYFISVFVICVVMGILGLLSYNDKNSAERAALGVILLFVVLSPITEMIASFDTSDFDPQKFIADLEIGEEFSKVGEAALADGICRAVCEKFSFAEEDVSATLEGFVFEEMRAKRVRIVLSGRAALSDSRAVKKYVDEMGVGESEVGIEFG